jgi:hypothetical protein
MKISLNWITTPLSLKELRRLLTTKHQKNLASQGRHVQSENNERGITVYINPWSC